tara:strand:+ start:2016 stop:3392 length:1377 start_codon:yes stop_codon:yes gene_type:complete
METNKVTELVLESVEKLLVEGRVENIKKKWPNVSWDVIDKLVGVDPSKTNKFLEWVVKNYMNGRNIKWFKDNANNNSSYYSWTELQVPDTAEDPRWEDDYSLRRNAMTSINNEKAGVLKDNLEHFFKNASKYEIKDINQFKSAKEFEDAAEIAKQKLSRKEMKDTGVDKVFEDDRFILMMPKTHKASCRYGARTRWCVTMRGYSGYFESYFGQGPIFFLIDKSQPERSYSPSYMNEAESYWKVAIHYRPFNGRLSNDGQRALQYAKDMTKEEFVNGANIGNSRIDYWNVQDDSKKESVVGKYLGGPGRGQTQRAGAILSQLKEVMEKYTKKVMSDYYDSLDITTEDLEKLQELKNKSTELGRQSSDMYYKIDRLETVTTRLRNFDDRLDTDGKDDEYRQWVSEQIVKSEEFSQKIKEVRDKIEKEKEEVDEKVSEFEEKMSSEGLVFYDKERNVPMNR